MRQVNMLRLVNQSPGDVPEPVLDVALPKPTSLRYVAPYNIHCTHMFIIHRKSETKMIIIDVAVKQY